MSSLLERMVQRTRDRLPGIEPLLQPRYAPQGSAGQRSRTDATDSMDSFTEASRCSSEESGSANARSEALPAPQAANLRDTSVSETLIYVDREPRREPLQTTQSVLERYRHRHSGVEPLPGTQTDQQRSGSLNPEAEPAVMPAQRVIGRDDSAAQIVPAKLASPSREGSSAMKAASLKAANSTAVDSIASKISPNEQTAVTLRVQAAPATLRSSENESSRRQQLLPVSHIEARVVEKTSSEVTISIGHIEIRAAQVAERPRRPAFRPRVSLNDFLNPQNGQRNRDLG